MGGELEPYYYCFIRVTKTAGQLELKKMGCNGLMVLFQFLYFMKVFSLFTFFLIIAFVCLLKISPSYSSFSCAFFCVKQFYH